MGDWEEEVGDQEEDRKERREVHGFEWQEPWHSGSVSIVMFSLRAKYAGHGEGQEETGAEGKDGCVRGGVYRARPPGAPAHPAHAELRGRIDEGRRDRRPL